MGQKLYLKSSTVAGNKPTTSSLDLRELGINTYDGKIYFHKSSSVDSIQEIITTEAKNTGSIWLSGSFYITGSIYQNTTNPYTTGAYQLLVSNTSTGRYETISTSSFVMTSQTSSMNVLSSSYALSASWAPGGGGSLVRPITFDADGLGGVITAGSRAFITVPYSCTLTDFYLVADLTGSIQIDVKVAGTSIVGAGNKLIISSNVRAHAALSGWTSTSVSAFTDLEFYVDSCTTIQKINAVLVAAT